MDHPANHGVAVAYAAHRVGLGRKQSVPAKIFVPTVSAPAKLERIRRLGAELVVTGDRYADALDAELERRVVTGADGVLTPARSMLEYFQARYRAEGAVVPNAWDTDLEAEVMGASS